MKTAKKDTPMVDHPSHYGGDTVYEAIKVIEAWGLGFNLGNLLKYVCRSEKKDNRLQNLQKARWYLDREIQNLEIEIRRETSIFPYKLENCPGHRIWHTETKTGCSLCGMESSK